MLVQQTNEIPGNIMKGKNVNMSVKKDLTNSKLLPTQTYTYIRDTGTE